MELCVCALKTQMITDGPTVGILPTFPFSTNQITEAPHRLSTACIVLTPDILLHCNNVLPQAVGRPPTWTTIFVPTVSQGLQGKQQLKSCNYSLNVPGQNA